MERDYNEILGSRLHIIFNQLYKLIIINFLFIMGTFVGLIIFGIGPSIYASQNLIKEYREAQIDGNYLSRFIHFYKSHFIKVNKIFLIYVLLGGVLYLNTIYYQNMNNSLSGILLLYISYSFILITIISFITIFGIEIRLNINFKNKLKASVLLPTYYLIDTIKFIFAFVLFIIIFTLFPQFTFFLAPAVYIEITDWYVNNMVLKLKDKYK